MPHHHPYPADPPLVAFQDAYRILKSGRAREESKDLAADIWTIQGYLQKLLIGDHSHVINGPPPEDIRPLAQQLLEALEEQPVVAAADSRADLSLVLTLLLPLLQKLLERLLNG